MYTLQIMNFSLSLSSLFSFVETFGKRHNTLAGVWTATGTVDLDDYIRPISQSIISLTCWKFIICVGLLQSSRADHYEAHAAFDFASMRTVFTDDPWATIKTPIEKVASNTRQTRFTQLVSFKGLGRYNDSLRERWWAAYVCASRDCTVVPNGAKMYLFENWRVHHQHRATFQLVDDELSPEEQEYHPKWCRLGWWGNLSQFCSTSTDPAPPSLHDSSVISPQSHPPIWTSSLVI